MKEFNVNGDWVIINRDTYRYQIGNGVYTMEHEDEVTKMEEKNVKDCIDKNKNMIIDATNLNPKYNKKWFDIAEKYGYEIEIKTFYVPYKEAMKRSRKRRDEGGLYISRDVMRHFYKKYYPVEFEKEMTDNRIKDVDNYNDDFGILPNCVICDLDGTVALHNGREPFEWDKLSTDVVDDRIRSILLALSKKCLIIFLTGRPEKQGNVDVKSMTEEWIRKSFKGMNYKLLMRDVDDYRSGEISKNDIYKKEILSKYNVLAVFEDSNKCVEMWRNEGLLCLQPDNGDY